MCEKIKELLSESRRIHMIGIGGIGMAGLAALLHDRGHTISGCDEQENRQTDWLRQKGISIDIGRDISHVNGVDWVIRTTAVPDHHPEVLAADVPVSRRGEVLPELLRDRFTIAVSGTHGKTTTTAMIAQILQCGFYIGGEVDGFSGTARDGKIMVVEADESDGTVELYHPDISVITNIEYDHMEHHESAAAFEACFERFIQNTREKIVYCSEDTAAVRLCKSNKNAVGYSASELPPQVEVSLPGDHNRMNAAAAFEVCRRWLSDEQIVRALERLRPVKRRFEIVRKVPYTVVSDYAHHPTEIRMLVQTAKKLFRPERLIALFQPHRYSRTQALLDDFPPAFDGVDEVWFLPVYAASEPPMQGGKIEDLLGSFKKYRSEGIKKILSLTDAWQTLNEEMKDGDVLLIIGAGDIEKVANQARA
jgi:UDP-N-acetylmuramate-alanine ligase